ncbi:MAG: hypothetical protein CSA97_04655 [Bacteroidetes bacterium]|nr:MAG: hypothetical protein CSA97_04655 [Bacteroidota bacterium]
MPDTFVIIFFVVAVAALLTYLLPKGHFETEKITYEVNGTEKSRTVIKDGTFEYVVDEEGKPQRVGAQLFEADGDGRPGFFNYMFEGLVTGDKWGSAVGVVAFILVIGGAFGVLMHTGAIEAGIFRLIKRMAGKEILLIPVLFLLFSSGGAIFGMGEESIPFVMMVIPMVIAMGYDSIVGIMITFGATQVGFATSWMNPFSVAIAQGIAGIPVLSAANFRIVMWLVFNVVSIAYILWYAARVKKNPEKSLAYKTDEYFRKDLAHSEGDEKKFGWGERLIILTLLLTIVWVIWGVVEKGYYIPEIASQFFVMGLVAGVIGVIFKLNGMKVNDIAGSFKQGAADLLAPAMIVGMAQGIVYVLGGTDPTQGSVLNTILNGAASSIQGFAPVVSATIMFLFQAVFNFFVTSGSGQAALTMPLMAPLADLAGVTRQVAVLAFQLGDGLTNIFVPTSGILMAAIGVARMEWGTWAKFMIKFQGVLFALAIIFVVVAVMMGLS